MQPTQWSGMITNASPHSIPHGASVDQMNLSTSSPGQLTTRGGMRIVSAVSGGAFDVHGYVSGGYYWAIILTSTGGIGRLKGVGYGQATGSPSEPSLVATGAQAATSYTQKCLSALEDL